MGEEVAPEPAELEPDVPGAGEQEADSDVILDQEAPPVPPEQDPDSDAHVAEEQQGTDVLMISDSEEGEDADGEVPVASGTPCAPFTPFTMSVAYGEIGSVPGSVPGSVHGSVHGSEPSAAHGLELSIAP